jgi:hypothetical protein
MDAVASGDSNVIEREAEEILKQKDVPLAIQRMCNVQTTVIPAAQAQLDPSQITHTIPEQLTDGTN